MAFWQTTLKLKPSDLKISHETKIATLGSCFSDNLGIYLEANKFNVLANPYGNIYNLGSLEKTLKSLYAETAPEKAKFVKRDDLVFHLDYHSEIFASTELAYLEKIKKINLAVKEFIQNAEVLVLTFGTSWVYELISSGEVVSNCQKQDPKLFHKKLLDIENQLIIFKKIHEILTNLDPNLEVIISLSPVRHIKDGLEENQVSKSILRVLIHKIEQIYKKVYYFPAYEIVLDELRDYRFYDRDLIHPSAASVEYILEKFEACFIHADTAEILKKWSKIRLALNHRAQNPSGDKHQQFLLKLKIDLQYFRQFFNIDAEEELLAAQIL
jgi:hypothetical protein